MFLVLVTLIAIIPSFFKRFKVPKVVSIMLVGIVIGPNGADLLLNMGTLLGREHLVGEMYSIVDAMGLLGLVFLMALAGMEINLNVLKKEKKAVSLLSFFTFFLPAAAGYFVYSFFRPDDHIGKLLYASLFASHAVAIVFPTIREFNIVRTKFGFAILASTVITDLASLILLALAFQMKRQVLHDDFQAGFSIFDLIDPHALGSMFLPFFLLIIILYIFATMAFIPALSNRVFRSISPSDDSSLTIFLMVLLLVVFVGEIMGVNVIVGAFVAGMALARSRIAVKDGHLLQKKLEGVGYGLLIPFLFLSIGMKTDLAVLISAWENMAIVALTFMGLVGSKMFSGWLAMYLAGFGHKKGFCAGLMTVPQLSATLAAATIGLEYQIIDYAFFNAIVCLSILTTLPVPTLLKVAIDSWKISFESPDESMEGFYDEYAILNLEEW